MRITNNNITELRPNEIFVFGSNLSGIHGGGAAKLAKDKFGAKLGVSTGVTGQCYAIPTKSEYIVRTLTIKEIKPYVDDFISFASENKDYTFLVTEIGCGLAGLKHEHIAPLFKLVETEDIGNIHLPQKFWDNL